MDDWDTVTKIGSKVRGAGTTQRETTIKTKSQLNAAQRSGAVVGTEKKYTNTNAGGGSSTGQLHTKVDRADGPVAPKRVSKAQALALQQARQKMTSPADPNRTMKVPEFAQKSGVAEDIILKWEKGGDIFPEMKWVVKMEKTAKVHLTGPNIGKEKEDKHKNKGAAPAKPAKK